jgi:hypothetical protein
MSYHLTKRPTVPARRRRSLSDWMSDVTDNMVIKECLDQANQQTAPFDAKIDALVKNWKPTGFYTADDVRTIVGRTLEAVQSAQAAVNQAAAEPNASQDSVMRATSDLGRAGQRSLDYLDAAKQAEAQGIRVVNAPGLKRWVTDTLGAASSAMVTAAVIGCTTPWWVGALAWFQTQFDQVWGAVRMIVGAALTVGEAVLQVPDALGDMITILKWGLGIGGAAYLVNEIHRHRTGRSLL